MKHIKHTTASEFNMDALEAIVRDLRSARRATLAIETSREELQERFDQALLDNQAALDECDLDEVTRQTQIMKRIKTKLSEDPTGKHRAFSVALRRLETFVNTNNDEPWAEDDADATDELKEAA